LTDTPGLLIELRSGDPRPLYVQIMDEVRRALALGDLEPGDILPSVRSLASELAINPNTVAKAYRELESDGTVRGRRGRGTFVTPAARPETERPRITREVARRALRDARRHGISVDRLVRALREEAGREDRTIASMSAHAPEGEGP